jgi:hypothetical protein
VVAVGREDFLLQPLHFLLGWLIQLLLALVALLLAQGLSEIMVAILLFQELVLRQLEVAQVAVVQVLATLRLALVAQEGAEQIQPYPTAVQERLGKVMQEVQDQGRMRVVVVEQVLLVGMLGVHQAVLVGLVQQAA